MYVITARDAARRRLADAPLGRIEYNQSAVSPLTLVRSDCSGWTWSVWGNGYTEGDGMWLGAPSTESMVRLGLITEIPFSQLRPGDAIGRCGPGSANGGGGHIAPWLEGDRTQKGRHHVIDHGSGMGPKDRWVKWDGTSTGWLHPDHLRAWRYVGIREEDMRVLVQLKGNPAVYIADGITRRWVRSVAELKAIQATELVSGGPIKVVDDLAPYGVVVGPDYGQPEPTPEPGGHAELLAKLGPLIALAEKLS